MPLLVVIGYGPGVSQATAERFGKEGYAVALVGRTASRLADGLDRLRSAGVDAHTYEADASSPEQIRATISAIRAAQGSITRVLWTAFRNGDVTDVLASRPEHIERVFDIGVAGLLTAVQATLEDLKGAPDAAVLVANGAVGALSTQADQFAKMLNIDGTALENAAKSKLVGLLAERLREDSIYVGEITIVGSVLGTATASPTAIDPAAIADQFWSMAHTREVVRTQMSEAPQT